MGLSAGQDTAELYGGEMPDTETGLFTKKKGMKKMKKETWKTILQVIVTVLTALCTSLGVTSCM